MSSRIPIRAASAHARAAAIAALIVTVACSAGGGSPRSGDVPPVLTAPAFLTQPSDQEAREGERATFAAGVEGNPAPELQWERSAPGSTDWAELPGATGPAYTTAPLAAADGGARYRVRARNDAGVRTSREASLRVSWLHLLASPTGVAVLAGGDATFEAAFDGDPAPALQWQSAAPGGAWADVAGATTGVLTRRGVTALDDGLRVRAVATSAAGTIASAEATLTVTTTPPPPPGPTISAFAAVPAQITAGGATRLEYAFANGTGSIDGTALPGSSGTLTETPDATRTYTLTVTGEGGQTVARSATVTVYPVPVIRSFTVPDHVPPGVSATLVADFAAGAGGTATIDQAVGAVQSGIAATTRPITAPTTFTLTVTNALGVSASTTKTITLGIDVAPGGSIPDAIGAATPGTTVYVNPGTYSPAATAEAFLVFRAEKNGVVVRGTGASPEQVVLDGQGRVLHVVFFDQGIDASTRLENLTITGGRALPDELFPGGFTPELRPEISQTALPYSDFYNDGAGAMLFLAAPVIERVVFHDNVANRCAGAISVFATPSGPDFPAVGPLIRDCEFHHNHTGLLGNGGAIDVYSYGTRATIVNGLFVGNTGSGGQVAVLGGSSATIRSSTFIGSQGPLDVVGGVMVERAQSVVVQDSVFVDQSLPGLPPVQLRLEPSIPTELAFEGNLFSNADPAWTPPAGFTMIADPLFTAGPRGSYYLSQLAAGQAATSPAVDAGTGAASDLAGRTTRTDGVPDAGAVDVGYHYAP
ncbi:hypothetical protein [Anaeromyxobacter dehalogenans]|uniref:Ig-like domain-containing protein n=1 Tax=Anaeromyxobacter dehalogenans (strain 2CP-C) TaxID=290397 RepID=Q2IPN0_ANADE|nr:hypothetical protein [Anaeromyxobacter dehalogenans]ABC80766.1 hypothetical protein Adeh_0991 [Anaeromyxobacter dehalogenans 2CP-C]